VEEQTIPTPGVEIKVSGGGGGVVPTSGVFSSPACAEGRCAQWDMEVEEPVPPVGVEIEVKGKGGGGVLRHRHRGKSVEGPSSRRRNRGEGRWWRGCAKVVLPGVKVTVNEGGGVIVKIGVSRG